MKSVTFSFSKLNNHSAAHNECSAESKGLLNQIDVAELDIANAVAVKYETSKNADWQAGLTL